MTDRERERNKSYGASSFQRSFDGTRSGARGRSEDEQRMKGRALSAGGDGGNLERGEILCLSSVSGVCASKVKIVLSVDVGRYTRACVRARVRVLCRMYRG